MTKPLTTETIERGFVAILFDDLAGVDDDDDVRTVALFENLLEQLEQRNVDESLLEGTTVEDACWHLRRMIRSRMTAGELRASIRDAYATIAEVGHL